MPSEHEESLLSASTLREALESVGEGVVVADAQGRFLLFNSAAEKIVGVGALNSDPDSWAADYGLFELDRKTPFPAPEIPLAQALRGRSTDEVEMYVKNPNRSEGLFISVSGRPIRSREGQVIGGVVIFRDITERRARERSLEESNSALTAANQALKDFISVAGHDLRGPLAAVIGFASMMIESWESLPEEKKIDFLQIIARQSRSAMRLCEDLLTLSRLEAGHVSPHPEEIDLRPIVSDVLRSMPEMRSEISVNCGESLLVLCDREHLERMLTNYLVNAQRYGEPPFELQARVDDGYVAVDVSDHGPGIPAEFADRLFTKFSRGPNARAGSSGLGLSIVRGLAEANGGEAFIDPDYTEGARFVIRIPRAKTS